MKLQELIIVTVGFLEFVFIIVGILFMIIAKVYYVLQKRVSIKREVALNRLLSQVLISKKEIFLDEIPLQLLEAESILNVLEAFDHRFSDQIWQQTKETFIEDYIKPYLKNQFSKYPSKGNRLLLMRAIKLSPCQRDKEFIKSLLVDSSYMIRSLAGAAAVVLKTPEMIRLVLKQMGKEPIYCRYAFREALLNSDQEVYDQIYIFYNLEEDIDVRKACLDVFIYRAGPKILDIISRDLKAPFTDMRVSIAKILAQYQSTPVIKYLTEYLQDEHWEVRAAAAHSLGKLKAVEAIPFLGKAIQDENYRVRLQAGLALLAIGNKGIEVLRQQDYDLEERGYHMARYILTMAGL